MTLTEAIQGLGTTKQSVSAKLREMGIKGSMFSAGWCPIARYCRAVTGHEVLVSDMAKVFPEGADTAEERIELPKHVKAWILDFDGGVMPEFDIAQP